MGGPGRGRLVGDVDVEDAAPVMGEDEEAEQDLVADGRHREEVDRDQVAEMVRREHPPGLGRPRACRPRQTPGDGGFGKGDPESQELAVNPAGRRADWPRASAG
jgi:hypothetical protein